MQGSKIWNNAP